MQVILYNSIQQYGDVFLAASLYVSLSIIIFHFMTSNTLFALKFLPWKRSNFHILNVHNSSKHSCQVGWLLAWRQGSDMNTLLQMWLRTPIKIEWLIQYHQVRTVLKLCEIYHIKYMIQMWTLQMDIFLS